MVEISVTWPLQDLIKDFDQMDKVTIGNMEKAVKASAYLLQAYAVTHIQGGPRSGHIYKRRSITHQASAEGEWPKTDTGRLASSIRVNTDTQFLSAEVGSDVDYAGFLETKDPAKGGRPWLSRALFENTDNINTLFELAMEQGLNGQSI